MALIAAPAWAPLPDPPSTTSSPPSAQSHSDACNPDDLVSVTAAGSVFANGQTVTWWVEYGPTTAYGSHTAAQTTTTNGPVTALLPGVPPGTLHYRLVLPSTFGDTVSADQTVTTTFPTCPTPRVQAQLQLAAADTTGLEPDSCTTTAGPNFFAVMTAVVTPIYTFSAPALTTGNAVFQYGPTAAYGSVSAATAVPWLANVPTSVSVRVENVTQNLHYALIVTDPAGTRLFSPDTTLTLPTVAPCKALVPLSKATSTTIAWTLERTSHDKKSIVIRYRPPCSSTKPIVSFVVHTKGNEITVAVVVKYTPTSCARKPALVTKTIKLPATLKHRRLRHVKAGTKPSSLH